MYAMGPPPFKIPEKPPLITPSASPPPARLPGRMSDSASPTKKQRLNSTPRHTPSEVSSSASRTQLLEDVQKERDASKMRLFDVWSSLAERYTIPVEEDDIINIQTGEITRDNGYLRKSKKLDFGAIALGDAAAEEYDSPEDEEDEYDIDELDAFADDISESSYHEVDDQTDADLMENAVPPTTVLTAVDAEDLREFMNAERLRRELYGSDLDDEEVEGYSSPYGQDTGTAINDNTTKACNSSEDVNSDERESDKNQEETTKEDEEHLIEDPIRSVERLISVDPNSEDELDNWNIDDASVVYPIIKSESSDHHRGDTDSEVEIIDGSRTNLSVQYRSAHAQEEQSHLKKPNTSRPRQVHKPLHQLYTPPQFGASFLPSVTSSNNVIDLSRQPSPQSSPVRLKISKSRSDAPSKTKHTSKMVKDTPVLHANPKHAAKGKGTVPDSQLSPSNSLVKTPKKVPAVQPYVLITPKRGSNSHKVKPNHPIASTSRSVEGRESARDRGRSSAGLLSKGKGKASELYKDNEQHESDSQNSSSSVLRGRIRQQSRHRSISSCDESEPDTQPFSNKSLRFGAPKGKSQTNRSSLNGAKLSKENIANDKHGDGEPFRRRQSNPPPPSPFKKRKRRSLDTNSDISDYAAQNHEMGNSPLKSNRKLPRPSSSRVITANETRSQQSKTRSLSRRRDADTESGSDDGYGTESSASNSGKRYPPGQSHSSINAPTVPSHHAYHHVPYGSSHYQPLPDPRAQLIISQAMQQLSALVGAGWAHPHHYVDAIVPNTPHRKHDGRLNGTFVTPTRHPHPYPYIYDPNLSNATLPPESPEFSSSPSKSSSARRKSLVKRSRSRGRRVSFNLESDICYRLENEVVNGYSSPPDLMPSNESCQNDHPHGSSRGDRKDHKNDPQRQKREKTPGRRHELADDSELGVEVERSTSGRAKGRGQTPGPSTISGERPGTGRPHSGRRL